MDINGFSKHFEELMEHVQEWPDFQTFVDFLYSLSNLREHILAISLKMSNEGITPVVGADMFYDHLLSTENSIANLLLVMGRLYEKVGASNKFKVFEPKPVPPIVYTHNVLQFPKKKGAGGGKFD